MSNTRRVTLKAEPPEQVSRPGEQCNCAHHDKSAQQPPSGAMTIERAREIATQAMSESDGAICGISDCPTCIDAVTKALIDSDRAARREILGAVREEFLNGRAMSYIERRLKEINANRREVPKDK
jgi:hypothetical protein